MVIKWHTKCKMSSIYPGINLKLQSKQTSATRFENIFWDIFEMFTHCGDVIMGVLASQITSLTIVCSNVYSGADQRTHQSSASLAFVWEIHRRPVNSQQKWPVTRKMFPFDDAIMYIWKFILQGNGGTVQINIDNLSYILYIYYIYIIYILYIVCVTRFVE